MSWEEILVLLSRNIAALWDKRQKNRFLNAADQSKYLSEAENSKKT
jgi:hypothetical protein